MRILVTGISGQLGYDVVKQLEAARGNEVKGVSSADFDIACKQEVMSYIKGFAPDAVIHCAAYTAVDKAESDSDRCYEVNALGTQNIAEAVRDTGGKMLYVSTDYVFDGGQACPYEIDDITNPLNAYGRSKREGETAVQSILQKYFTVRTSWVFGSNGANFVKTMLKLGKERGEVRVVADQFGSPTYTEDLAKLIAGMIRSDKYGVYHATNEGFCSWYEFACEIFGAAKMDVKVTPITSEEYPAAARRPKNSRLSKKSLTDAGFMLLPDWKEAVKGFIGFRTCIQ